LLLFSWHYFNGQRLVLVPLLLLVSRSLVHTFFLSLTVYVGTSSVGGIVVSIAAFQAVDPGSIPGRRSNFIFDGSAIYNLSFLPGGHLFVFVFLAACVPLVGKNHCKSHKNSDFFRLVGFYGKSGS
jgi:hypothetical protein